MADKNASFMEQRWEDILAKKGYVVDQSVETEWEDTLYINPYQLAAKVIIHEAEASFYLIEVDGEVVTQGTDPDKLWEILSNLPEPQHTPVKHDREINQADRELMGIQASIVSPLLRKTEPKLAFEFHEGVRQYDYEASGNDAVLTSPSNTTKLLQSEEAQDFWAALDSLGEQTLDAPQEEYDQKVQALIQGYFQKEVTAGLFDFDRRTLTDRRQEPRADGERRQMVVENAKTWAKMVKKVDPETASDFAGFYLKKSPDGGALLADVWPQYQAKHASVKYAIQVDATSLKKASVTFLSGVEWSKGTVSKLKFTADREKARMFSARIAKKIQDQLPEFKLAGALVKG